MTSPHTARAGRRIHTGTMSRKDATSTRRDTARDDAYTAKVSHEVSAHEVVAPGVPPPPVHERVPSSPVHDRCRGGSAEAIFSLMRYSRQASHRRLYMSASHRRLSMIAAGGGTSRPFPSVGDGGGDGSGGAEGGPFARECDPVAVVLQRCAAKSLSAVSAGWRVLPFSSPRVGDDDSGDGMPCWSCGVPHLRAAACPAACNAEARAMSASRP